MTKESPQYQTSSGVNIPVSDVVEIRKDARNQTVLKILAGIGLFTVGYIAIGLMKAAQAVSSAE